MRISHVVAGLMLVSGGLAMAGTRVVAGPDLGFSAPSVDASGRVAVIERRHYVEQEPGCALLNHSDLVSLDLRADCGQDIIREGMHMVGSRDASITAAGGSIAWRTAVTSGVATFTTGGTDFGNRIDWHTDTVATQVDHLEISGPGDRMAYWRQAGGQDEIVRLDLGFPPATATVLDAGSSLLLNDAHPVADDGTVVYCKYVVPFYRLFRRGPADPAPVAVPSPCANDRRLATISRDGLDVAYTCDDLLGGATDVYVNGALVVDNTTTAWAIKALDISRDGSTLVFVSNGDFESGENTDGSVEVFRVAATGGPVEQVTDFSIFGPQQAPYIRGVSTNEDGTVILYGAGSWATLHPEPCTPSDHHSLATWYESLDVPTPPMSATPASELVMPPFDVAGAASPCAFDIGTNTLTCTADVRGSQEGPRNVLLVARWTFVGAGLCLQSSTEQAVPFTVAAGQQAQIVVSEALPPPCTAPLSGFVRIRAISPDVLAADVASRDLAFIVP